MDDLVNVIDTLLGALLGVLPAILDRLPAEWVARVEMAFEVIGAVSVALVAIKPAVAKWVTSPEARHWCDAIIKWFDLVASNTKGMDLRPLARPKSREKKK